MMRIKDGEQGEFYIIPVWDFMGNGVEIDPVDGREYALSGLSDTASIVTINAIDGSNFDRFYMY